MPPVHGEKVVIRILDKSQALSASTSSVMADVSESLFERGFRRPYGAVLVTGPDRLGQVHHPLRRAQRDQHRERNIITIEDPVEYQIAGINQVQVNPRPG